MRTKLPLKLLIATALTLVGLVVAQQFSGVLGRSAEDKSKADKPDSLNEIAKYRSWTLVNPSPVVMNPKAAADCAAVVAGPVNPHETWYASVYVNPKGAGAMMTEEHPRFPEGSIIVKEKLRNPDSKEPALLTAMIKRKPGFNPESRDWEYLLLDGAATKILEQGRLSRCNECHEKYVYTDFVTMRYLKGKPSVD